MAANVTAPASEWLSTKGCNAADKLVGGTAASSAEAVAARTAEQAMAKTRRRKQSRFIRVLSIGWVNRAGTLPIRIRPRSSVQQLSPELVYSFFGVIATELPTSRLA